jgi:hypothetical protein
LRALGDFPSLLLPDTGDNAHLSELRMMNLEVETGLCHGKLASFSIWLLVFGVYFFLI